MSWISANICECEDPATIARRKRREAPITPVIRAPGDEEQAPIIEAMEVYLTIMQAGKQAADEKKLKKMRRLLYYMKGTA